MKSTGARPALYVRQNSDKRSDISSFAAASTQNFSNVVEVNTAATASVTSVTSAAAAAPIVSPTSASPMSTLATGATASAAVVTVGATSSAAAEPIVVAGLCLKALDISSEAAESIYAETSQYSITPSSFASRIFSKDCISDKWFIDQFRFKANGVLRFGINHSAVKREDITGERFEILDAQASASATASPESQLLSPLQSSLQLHSHSPSLAAAGAGISPARSQASRSSKSKIKYSDAEMQKIKHHSLERFIFSQAIEHLLKESEDNKTALVDIFARSTPDGAIKFLANGYAETHTVMLLKNPATPEGKHEVLVIDPNNFLYSSHMANEDIVPPHPLLLKVVTMHSSDQIYKPEGKTGSNYDQYRDCIDIAAKLAFGFNKLAPELRNVNLHTVVQLDVVKAISNMKKIDDAFTTKNKWLRIKQASDAEIVQKFYATEQEIYQLHKAVNAFSDSMYADRDNAYQKILDDDTAVYQLSLQKLLGHYIETADILHGEFRNHCQSLTALIGDDIFDQNLGG